MEITGSQPPVVRATIVASVFILGTVIQRKTSPFNSLGAAALFILLMDARQLFDVGFQLSFVAVLSIVYLYPIMNGWIAGVPLEGWKRKATVWTLRVCALSLAASLGTLPLTAMYFGRISVVGLVANIIVIPASAGALLLGFATVGAALVSQWLATVYGALNQLLLSLTLTFVKVTGSLPFSSVDASRFSLLHVLPFYAALLLLFNLRQKAARPLLFILLGSLAVTVFIPPSGAAAPLAGKLRVSFLDVGQGDASVVEFPDGRVMVVDAGASAGQFNAGDRTVAPFLRRRGVSRIDLLVLSHPHDDHIGGAPVLLREFDVLRVVEAGMEGRSGSYRSYVSDLAAEQCGVDTGRAGLMIAEFGGARLYFLGPDGHVSSAADGFNVNNASVVVKLHYGNVAFLFAGDAELESEAEMVRRYDSFLHSAVLKAGHHGSNTSTSQDFLSLVRPRFAIVSAGRFNKFGHPSPEVIQRFEAMGVDVLRTDLDGAIILETDGNTVSFVDWR
jgi:competence protein ComEC